MAQKAHRDFWTVVEYLWNAQDKEWNPNYRDKNRKTPKGAKDLFAQLRNISTWHLIDKETIQGWKKECDSPVDFDDSRSFMFLPPLIKDALFVPVLSISYTPCADFAKSCLRMRVFLIRNEEDLMGVGFRIESPEKHCQNSGGQEAEKTGMHDFYHAQLINTFGCGPEISSPQWLPCRQPSFPLWATNPIDAICSLILTLYGGLYFKQFMSEATSQCSVEFSTEFGNAPYLSR